MYRSYVEDPSENQFKYCEVHFHITLRYNPVYKQETYIKKVKCTFITNNVLTYIHTCIVQFQCEFCNILNKHSFDPHVYKQRCIKNNSIKNKNN